MMLLRALLLWLGLATTGLAQGLPAPQSLELSDYAGVLDTAAQREIHDRVRQIRADRGVQVTVVTIARRADYGDFPDIAAFAKDLFNAWGVGDARANDGVMMVLAVADRETRIALGRGYPPVWDGRALQVIERIMVPRFADGDYAGGLIQGLDGLDTYLIHPFIAGQSVDDTAPPPDTDGPRLDLVFLFMTIAAVFGYHGWKRRGPIGDMIARRRPCPNCGRKGIVIDKVPDRHGLRITRRCPHCDWNHGREMSWAAIARAEQDSDDDFGGGSSSGGGASGRW